jgi:hypothetical protein
MVQRTIERRIKTPKIRQFQTKLRDTTGGGRLLKDKVQPSGIRAADESGQV